MSEKAIIAKFECPSCGHEIVEEQLMKITNNGKKFNFEAPKVCNSCGLKSGFKLLNFVSARADVRIIPDN